MERERPFVDMSDPAVRRLVTAAHIRQRQAPAVTPARIDWHQVWFWTAAVIASGCAWGVVIRAAWQFMQGGGQ